MTFLTQNQQKTQKNKKILKVRQNSIFFAFKNMHTYLRDEVKNMKSIFKEVAQKTNSTDKAVKSDIQEAIDAAWNSKDPSVKAFQRRLFPNGKPTPEEFILVMGNVLRTKVN